MKAGWQTTPFEDCIEPVTYTTKIQRKDFLSEGAFPIVSQEEDLINGRWGNDADLFKVERPLVLFGDHTRSFKYVDFDFVLGADGVKILKPKAFLHPRYFYFQLHTAKLESLGYARHYRLLKEHSVSYPDFAEQRRIVTLLDEAFADIATAKANAEKNLQNARELFESHLDASFGERNESWTEKALQDIGLTQTGSTPKTSDQANYGNVLPFIKPGDFAPDGTLNYENDGLSAQGAASARKVSANSVLMVCIGATIGKCGYAEREIATNQQINAFTPVAGVDKKFIYYQMLTKRFQDSVIHSSGQATLPIINKSKWSALTIYLPGTLGEQEAIAKKMDFVREETQRLEYIYRQKLTALDDLRKSLLHQAFIGQL